MPSTAQSLDVTALRAEFPILSRTVNGKSLVYLDSAATTQKPRAVLDAITGYYERSNANVHRGVHRLSVEATEAYERARDRSRAFLNAADVHEIVFVRGTTEAMNLVAQSWGRANLGSGDEVLITHMEHHSGIVPWQMICAETGAVLRVAPIDDSGALDRDAFETLVTERTKIVSAVHVSNALGTVNPVEWMTEVAHRVGALVMIDGAQAAPHVRIDVRAIGCDFYAISSHKMFGPTGIGVLWARRELLEAMPPYQGGGEMIKSVTFEGTTYSDVPHKFEAGTPNIAGAVGMGAAIDWLMAIDPAALAAHEHDLTTYGTALLAEIPGLRLIGTAEGKASVLSFVLDGVHPHDVGTILDHEGVAVRTGHHCAQPVMDRFGVPATARASLAIYNERSELDALAAALRTVCEIFG